MRNRKGELLDAVARESTAAPTSDGGLLQAVASAGGSMTGAALLDAVGASQTRSAANSAQLPPPLAQVRTVQPVAASSSAGRGVGALAADT
jgi:hypothetical protein